MIDYYVTSNLHKYISFADKPGCSMNNFSQQTHQWYVYRDPYTNKVVSDPNHSGILLSTWTVIQDLKLLFNRLKSEPYKGTDGTPGDTVYDHTYIQIISDHGYIVNKLPNFISMLQYLETNKVLSAQDVDVLRKFYYFSVNPVICIKDFKKNAPDKTQFTFNTDQFITLGDLCTIQQNMLNKYTNQNLESAFFSQSQLDAVQNLEAIARLKTAYLANPLDSNVNSFANQKLRSFDITSTRTWKYDGGSKTFLIVSDGISVNPMGYKNLFNNNIFKDIIVPTK